MSSWKLRISMYSLSLHSDLINVELRVYCNPVSDPSREFIIISVLRRVISKPLDSLLDLGVRLPVRFVVSISAA